MPYRQLLLLLCLVSTAYAEPLRAVAVVAASGQTVAGSVSSADATAILFQPKDGAPVMLPLNTLSSLKIEEPKDWSAAMGALHRGKFDEAARLFAQLSQAHQGLRPLRDSYGSLAKLYHLRALRSAEKWDSLSKELKLLTSAPLVLTQRLDQELKDDYAFAMLGTKDATGISAYLSQWEQQPQAKKDQPPSPFKPMPPVRRATLHLLRAQLLEISGKPDYALAEYRLAHTLGQGHDTSISLPALQHTIQHLKQNPGSKTEVTALEKLVRDLSS
jgi:hypothetical protein